MPIPGKSDLLIAFSNGDPTSVSTGIINPPIGSLVIDYGSTPPRTYQKTSAADNTGMQKLVGATTTDTLTNKTLTSPTITDPTIVNGTTSRFIQTAVFAVTGAALHAANLTAWTAPADAFILRVLLDITTPSTGASTIDVGYTAASATTSSDTLLDGVSGTPAALFDSMNAALDTGANALAQRAASGKWITMDEASGDVTGLVGKLYVQFILA